MLVEAKWKILVKTFSWSAAVYVAATLVATLIIAGMNNTEPGHFALALPYSTGFMLLVFWPFVYMRDEHGRQTFVKKHADQWNARRILEGNQEQFLETFGGKDVESVMETLREKRLELLARVEAIAAEHPEELDEDTSAQYLRRVREGVEAAVRSGQWIERARKLAVDDFCLSLPPTSYFMGPKPVELLHTAARASASKAEEEHHA